MLYESHVFPILYTNTRMLLAIWQYAFSLKKGKDYYKHSFNNL